MKNNNVKTLLVAVVTLALGLLLGKLLFSETNAPVSGMATETNKTWTCSMHPHVLQPEPGDCPICGMELVPLTESTASTGLEVKMSPTAMQLASVRTAKVGGASNNKQVHLNGKIYTNESKVFTQTSHIKGRIEQININFTGEKVTKGQVIAKIYSPELVTAQEELFEAYKLKDTYPELLEATKSKLRNWKLTNAQINSILKSQAPQLSFPILADITGVVTDKKINLGDHIMEGGALYEIADLSTVWVLFDVYESNLQWVKEGESIEFEVQAYPGEKFSGSVVFIDPVIDPATRVARARIEMDNKNGKFKPEMLVSGNLTSSAIGESVLSVPKTAVMWTGERSVVYIKRTHQTGVAFQMRQVVLGADLGEAYAIVSGLEKGEEIAVQGTFSIDAAAQLAGKPSMMNPEGTGVAIGHDHGTAKKEMATPKRLPVAAPVKTKLASAMAAYVILKEQLVEGNSERSNQAVDALEQAIGNIKETDFELAVQPFWKEHSKTTYSALKQMKSSKDLETKRTHFMDLSKEIIEMAQVLGPFDSNLYIQYCPMANNNLGASWLSDQDDIRNPYFGDMMLNCGEVTLVIK